MEKIANIANDMLKLKLKLNKNIIDKIISNKTNITENSILPDFPSTLNKLLIQFIVSPHSLNYQLYYITYKKKYKS